MSDAPRKLTQLAAAAALAILLASARVHADGETLMPGGAAAVGRGGATLARPTDPTSMLQNPALLVDLPDNQFYFGVDAAIDKICDHPYGYYGWGVYLQQDGAGNPNNPDDRRSEFGDPASSRYGNRHLDTVCNSGPFATLPQMAWALHLNDRLSVGFGFVSQIFVGGSQWGGKDGTIQTNDGPRPTPTRYQALYTEAAGLDPTGAVAYRVLPWLSIGATLQVELASADSYSVIALRAGTSPSNDMLARLHASDYFIPAVTFGVYAKPHRRLRLAGTFNWSDGLDGHGTLTFTTNAYHSGAVGSELVPLVNDPIKLKQVTVKMPWTAALAARYAQPRNAADSGNHMTDDVWDVEVDAAVTANHSMGSNVVQIANDFQLEFRRADGTPQTPLKVTQDDLRDLNFDRHALDVVVLRLGGSYNVLPGKLQVSGGGFFQTRGVDPSYANVGSFGLMRGALALGLTFRAGSVDLFASYSHIFQEELTVAPPDNQPRQVATDDPTTGFDQRVYQNGTLSTQPRTDPAAPKPANADAVAKLTQGAVFDAEGLRARVINAGRYTAHFDVISLGASYRF